MYKSIIIFIIAFWGQNTTGQILINPNGIKSYSLAAPWPTEEALSFLDSIEGYNFYSANEYHRSAMALEQKKAFIAYLKNERGLDKLVIEFTYAYGYWINKYLQTGDTTLIRIVTNKAWSFDKFNKNSPISHDSFDFFTWLYSFNQHQENKVIVVAIDLDEMHHAALELWSIQQFLLKDSLFTFFNNSYPLLQKVVVLPKPSISKVEKWYLLFQKELEIHKNKVEKVLGAEYVEFKKILLGVDDVIERNSTKNTMIQREKVLIRNFEREIAPSDIIYAQFGSGHLLLNNSFNKQDYLISAIEKIPKYTGKTLSIHVHCEKCELGKSRTAYKPYVLFKDPEKGYWWHERIGNFTDKEHEELIGFLKGNNSVIDLRNSEGRLGELSKLYQYLIVLF